MAVSKRLRAFDPHAPSRELATDEESPKLFPATALYRFYDQERRLLYIGITGQPRERWAAHRRKAKWWPLAAYVAVEVHPTEWQALNAERAAIRSENPSFNMRSRKGGN
ncbi:GIY-YIG nuclease family protein [Streptomyces sp. NPDC127074]|uniref:GIY-YIG nuclease family protein n=1 Tax=Streptomyces sp. NPDC127074 TaxID=3347130 RepID=UPI003646BC34